MHEYSIIKNVVESVLNEIENKKIHGKVKEIHIKKGFVPGHSRESFVQAYEILVKNTVLEGSKLVIEEKQINIKCAKCGYDKKAKEDEIDHGIPFVICPKCKNVVKLDIEEKVSLTKVVLES